MAIIPKFSPGERYILTVLGDALQRQDAEIQRLRDAVWNDGEQPTGSQGLDPCTYCNPTNPTHPADKFHHVGCVWADEKARRT